MPPALLELAQRATQATPNSGAGWRNLGLILQQDGAYLEAFDAYGRALALDPNDHQVALALSFCATRLGMKDEALTLARYYVQARPNEQIGLVTLANALLGLDRITEAHDLAASLLSAAPRDPSLWHLAGKTARASGALDEAAQALAQANSLEPNNPRILYDLAWTLADLGETEQALGLAEQAISLNPDPDVAAALTFLKATLLLAKGDLTGGWQAYRVRHDLALASAAIYDLELARWDGQASLKGKHVLLMAEQGLGDELAHLGLMADLLRRIGSSGRVTLCADKRLKGLIERSWPSVRAIGHTTHQILGRRHRTPEEAVDADVWLPVGDLLPSLRPSLAHFDQPGGYLKPCPERLAHWRGWLQALPGQVKIGMAWRSHKMDDERGRNFAPLSAWRPILSRPGASFINLQYGDTDAEQAALLSQFGVVVHQPPGLDLFNDLEGLAALSAALDLGIGCSNASTNLLGAVGTQLHIIAPPASWPALGQEAYPWYPGARIHTPGAYGDWATAVKAAAQAIGA
jgi:tetratricopeptide (TPR) repeat protein